MYKKNAVFGHLRLRGISINFNSIDWNGGTFTLHDVNGVEICPPNACIKGVQIWKIGSVHQRLLPKQKIKIDHKI